MSGRGWPASSLTLDRRFTGSVRPDRAFDRPTIGDNSRFPRSGIEQRGWGPGLNPRR